jgi:hypothetical protein
MPRTKGSKNKKAVENQPEAVEQDKGFFEKPVVEEKAVAPVEKRTVSAIPEAMLSNVIMTGNLSKLTPEQKVVYYKAYCERVGLDPVTKPFELLSLNGKEVLYCTRSGTQQLSALHKVSHQITARELQGSAYLVTCRATDSTGRYSESIGAVNVENLKGDAICNAYMKAETKAKRRATLDLLGLGILDESEIETIRDARTMPLQEAQTPRVTNTVQQGGVPQVEKVSEEQLAVIRKKIASSCAVLLDTEYKHRDRLDGWANKSKESEDITVLFNIYKEVLAAGGVHKTFMITTKIAPYLEKTITEPAALQRAMRELKEKKITEVYSAFVDVKSTEEPVK